MEKAKVAEAETNPREALKQTNRHLRIVLNHLKKAGVAETDENVKRAVVRSKRQMRANRELLGQGK